MLGWECLWVFYKFSGEDVWDWNVVFEMNGYLLCFNVYFKDYWVVRIL